LPRNTLNASGFDLKQALKNSWIVPLLLSLIVFYHYMDAMGVLLSGRLSYYYDESSSLKDYQYYFESYGYSSDLWIWIFIAGAVAGFLSFSFLWSKKNVNFYLSKAVTRRQLVTNRTAAASIWFAALLFLPFALVTLLNLARLGFYRDTVLVGLLNYLAALAAALIGYVFAALGSVTAGNVVEAGLHSVAYIFSPFTLFWGIDTILYNFLRGWHSLPFGHPNYDYSSYYYGGADPRFGSKESILMRAHLFNPLLFFDHLTGKEDLTEVGAEYYLSSTKSNPTEFILSDLVAPLLWLIICAGLFALCVRILQKRPAEHAATLGANKKANTFTGVMISAATLFLIMNAGTYAMVSVAGRLLNAFVSSLIVFLAFSLIIRRKPKETPRYLLRGLCLPVLFFAIGATTYFGGWGYTMAKPDEAQITGVQLSDPVEGDILFFPKANGKKDYYDDYDRPGIMNDEYYLKNYSKMSEDEKRGADWRRLESQFMGGGDYGYGTSSYLNFLRYTSESDIKLALTLLDKLQTQKNPGIPLSVGDDNYYYGNENHDGSRRFRLVFTLKDGSEFVRSFVMTKEDVKDFLLEFYESDAAQEQFAKNVNALLLSFNGRPVGLIALDGSERGLPTKLPKALDYADLCDAILKDYAGGNAKKLAALSQESLGALTFMIGDYSNTYYYNEYWDEDDDDWYREQPTTTSAKPTEAADEEPSTKPPYEPATTPPYPSEYSYHDEMPLESRDEWQLMLEILPGMENTAKLLGLSKPVPPKRMPIRAAYIKDFEDFPFEDMYFSYAAPYTYFTTTTRYFSEDELNDYKKTKSLLEITLDPSVNDMYGMYYETSVPRVKIEDVWTFTDSQKTIESLYKRSRMTGYLKNQGVVLFEYPDKTVRVFALADE